LLQYLLMRIITSLISIFFFGTVLCQVPGSNELYKRIANYYQQNPYRLEVVRHVHKNVFRYDTTISHFGYLAMNEKEFFLFSLDTSYNITGGLFSGDENYILQTNSPEKILLTKSELKSNIHRRLNEIPAKQAISFLKLINRFGLAGQVSIKEDNYLAKTKHGYLRVDTSTFRITKVTQTIPYKKEYNQYDEFHYLKLPDPIEKMISDQVSVLTSAAKDYPIITSEELSKRNIPNESSKGKLFEFKHLVSINQGLLDINIKNKYIIFDFFYLSCLPCHKMTGYILDWLPAIDTSKVILVGVNPADSEFNMKTAIEKRKINYPVIIGNQAKELAKKYVQRGYPNLLLVSPDGIILDHHIGMSKSFLTKAEKIITQ
jgi:thioredoxin-related protein